MPTNNVIPAPIILERTNQNQDAETINNEYEDGSNGDNSSISKLNMNLSIEEDQENDIKSIDNWKGKVKHEEDKCCVCLEYIYCDHRKSCVFLPM